MSLEVFFHEDALEDYLNFKKSHPKLYEKINLLIKDINNDHYKGLGKPEPLKYALSGFWSRRISSEHRLVYQVTDRYIYVLKCRYHYYD